MSPARRRDSVARIEESHGVSERRACAVTSQHRSTQRYARKASNDGPLLLKAMTRLVTENPRSGCRAITARLRMEGWRVNYKRVHRLWKREGFKVPRKARKKRAIGDSSNACDRRIATARNDVWTWDFIHDRLTDGRAIKCLTMIDEYTRECLSLDMRRSYRGRDVVDTLSRLMGERGIPKHIRSDNGSEFIAREVKKWLETFAVEAMYIEPGAPWQNGYIESFNSRVRDEFLEMNYFTTMTEARSLAAIWKERYNTKRPHSSLNYLPPQTFAERCWGAGSASLRSAPPAPQQRTQGA